MSKDLIKGVLNVDPWLEPFSQQLIDRQVRFQDWYDKLTKSEGSLINFANSYKNYGLHALPDGSYKIVEYIPNVESVSLVGDFNNWNTESHPLKKANDFGLWELTIPAKTIAID